MILACVKLDTKLAGSDTASEKGFLFFTGPKRNSDPNPKVQVNYLLIYQAWVVMWHSKGVRGSEKH